MTMYRVVEYCGNTTFTKGWEKIYSIQPTQAWGNSDIDDFDVFCECIEFNQLPELDALFDYDIPWKILDEFMENLRVMENNNIGVLTLERNEEEEI